MASGTSSQGQQAASEIELERMVVRLIGDQSSYLKMITEAQQATRKGASAIGGEAGNIEKAFRIPHRAIFGISSALSGFAAGKPEQGFHAVAHSLLFMGGSAGQAGIAIIGLIAAFNAVDNVLKSTIFSANVAANQALMAFAQGSISAKKAVINSGETLGKEYSESILRALNPTGLADGVSLAFRVTFRRIVGDVGFFASGKQARDQYVNFLVGDLASKTREAEQVAERLTNDPRIKALEVGSATRAGRAQLQDMSEELSIRQALVGVAQEDVALEKLRQQLILKGVNIAPMEAEFRRLQAASVQTGFNEFRTAMEKSQKEAGLTAEQIKILELGQRGLSSALIEAGEYLAKQTEYVTKAKPQIKSLSDEVEDFGKSAIQALADHLDEFGAHAEAAQLRLLEIKKVSQSLNQDILVFNMTMAGATKSQIAFAQATDPLSAAIAKQKSLMAEGTRITQQYQLPEEKFAQTHRELSDLLNHGTISQDTYTRALAKARQELDGIAQAQQAVKAGSADAVSKIITYQDQLRATERLPAPIPSPGNAALAGSAEARTRAEKANTLLEQIRDVLNAMANRSSQAINVSDLTS